jgi:Protein of unknown function DUF262/Protein of unknown function (DUF1524)
MADALSEAPTFGIAKILQDGRFVVPDHQRDFAWTTDEVRQLFDDVEDAMSKPADSYFLGLLVFLTEGDRFTILDGQQRLATTTIIFAAIRDWLRQYEGYQDEARTIQDRYIGGKELGEKDPTPQLVLNRANNSMFFDYVVNSKAIEDVNTALEKLKRHDPNRELLKAVIYTHDRIKRIAAKINDPAESAQHFYALIAFFRDRIRTVRLTVADENAAYTLFETLNDRGIDLSPLDLVKNFLFKKAVSQSVDTLKDMQTRWVQMIATLANVKATSFLKAFWTSRHGRIRTNQLFSTFRNEYASPKKAVDLSVEMLGAAEQYAALESADDAVWSPFSKEARAIIPALKLLGGQQVHPVILSGLARFDISEMQKLLRLLEVCVVRFLLVVGGNPGRFEPACAKLADDIYKKKITTAASAFAELKAAAVYPPDAEFENSFRVKSERNSQKARYFLRAIEKERKFKLKPKMANEWEPSVLTLEHILPKKPGPEWKPQLGADKDLLEDCLMRLGNMCLLTSVNKELGSLGFEKKKKTYVDSDLELTKELASVGNWNRSAIEARQAQMAKLAPVVWRFK